PRQNPHNPQNLAGQVAGLTAECYHLATGGVARPPGRTGVVAGKTAFPVQGTIVRSIFQTLGKVAAKNRGLLVILGKYGLGLGLRAFVLWQNWDRLSDIFRTHSVQYLPLLLAAAISICSLILSFLRWYLLVRAQDLPFTKTNAVRLGLLGYFWSTFFPGS